MAPKENDPEPMHGKSNVRTLTDTTKSPDAKGDPRANRQLMYQPDERHDASKVWQQEYEHRLFISGSKQVRPMIQASTWLAFWNTAVDGESPASV
jgi:RNA polymerase sigma-70 factor (ECF subfamily)